MFLVLLRLTPLQTYTEYQVELFYERTKVHQKHISRESTDQLPIFDDKYLVLTNEKPCSKNYKSIRVSLWFLLKNYRE